MAYARETRNSRLRREEALEAERQRYGALNAIGGLNRSGRYVYSQWDHCLRPPIDPIYRGPCPPNPNGTDLEDVYASFYHEGALAVTGASPTVTTEDGVTFYRVELNSTAIISEEGIVKERTRVLVLDPGVYVVQYTFHVPDGQTANTTLALLYDRTVIPTMVTDVRKSITGVGDTVSAMSIIAVDSNGAELILGSTGEFTLTPNGFEPLVTLTLFSIA